MIIFLYGEDSYRSKKKLEEIIEQYKKAHKSGLNLIWVDVKEKDFSEFMDNFKIVSMFAEKKLIILSNVFVDANFREKLLAEIKNLNNSKDIIIVFEKDSVDPVRGHGASENTNRKRNSNGVDERSKLFKILKKEAKSQEFKLLDNRAMLSWIDKEFEKHKAKIDFTAKNIFLNCVGNNLWQAENEIKKLADFKAGKLIKKEDIELLVRPKIENDIFKTIDAIAQKNKKQAFNFLHKHIDNGDNILYLFSMIAYQFRNLLIIKELIEKGNSYENIVYGDIAKKSGLHPFVVKKNYELCRQFSLLQLKKIYQKIFLIDFNIKTGKVDAETALDLLVSEI